MTKILRTNIVITPVYSFFLLLSLAAIVSCNTPEEPYINRLMQQVIEYTWDAENLGKILGMIVRAIMLICVILMWIDCGSRYGGKSKSWIPVLHFIIFCFGASSWILIGRDFSVGYRGFNFPMFVSFYTYIYNNKGYFGSGHPHPFSPIKTESGQDWPEYVHYWNTLFFEITIYLILRIIVLIFTLMGKLKNKSKIAHLIDSIFAVYVYSWGFALFGHAMSWMVQEVRIGDVNNDTYKNDKVKKNSGQHVIGWIVVIYMILEALWMAFQILRWAWKAKSWNKKTTKKNESKTKKKPADLNNHNPETYEKVNKPQGEENLAHKDSNKECWVWDIYIDIAYMHMKKNQAIKTFLTMFYASGRLGRWALFTWMAHCFHGKPRTTYWIASIIDLIQIVWTILAMKSIQNPAGLLFLIEDILVFLWHFSQTILFTDLGTETKSLGKGWVWFLVVVIQIAFFACLLIEFILLFICLTKKVKEENVSDLESEEVKLDDLSEHDLNNKIQTYNTMKSKRRDKPKSGPPQNEMRQ